MQLLVVMVFEDGCGLRDYYSTVRHWTVYLHFVSMFADRVDAVLCLVAHFLLFSVVLESGL